MQKCITDLTRPELLELVTSLGEPGYRAGQLQRWIYRRFALSYEEMSDLPEAFRHRIAQETRLHSLTLVKEVTGQDGTIKALFSLSDGKTIESTLMSYPGTRPRHTLCLSTQVGCPIACPFCFTGQQGFERNLTPGEILDQVLYFARQLGKPHNGAGEGSGQQAYSITNLVFMGMGEPLANNNALLQAIDMLNSPQGFGLGARHMVVSTAGLVPQIKELIKENLQVELAISLHASENTLRSKLVPINKEYPLEALIPACKEYSEKTGRRISFEYILFEGINNSLYQARSLARLLKGLNCHVNLIPANRTASQSYRPPGQSIVLAFQQELKRLHVPCTVRQGKGLDIEAGCGQLRSRYIKGH